MTQSEAILTSLPPELRSRLAERIHLRLLRIIRNNLTTQYASKSTSLADLRDAISAHGIGSDTVLLNDFQTHVSLSGYESYKSFISKFSEITCEESEVVNLLAPGLPLFLFTSSGTSGRGPKLFPIYQPHDLEQVSLFFDRKGPLSFIFYFGYEKLTEIVRDDDTGERVKSIPTCIGTSGVTRGVFGWAIEDDDKRMRSIMPGYVSPWAASMITQYRSSLMIHALFTLACRELDSISTPFVTQFFDLLRFMDEEWDMFVFSIRNGTVPALEGVNEVRPFLQAHLHANPERAEELRVTGPPLSREGWAALVWPNLRQVTTTCSGPFAAAVPKVKGVLGTTITLRSPCYASSEAIIADGYADSLDVFILRFWDHVEFLPVTSEESHKELCQAYELEPGKQYEVVLTTRHGLWRYRLGDVIDILGFNAENGQPIFEILGRRGLAIRLLHACITDTHLIAAVQAIDPAIIRVHEFTAVVDDRCSPFTVGLLVELADDVGPNAHLAPQQFFDGLVATNRQHKEEFKVGWAHSPTVRILESGTFMEYRQWIASKMNTGSSQVKVPVIMLSEASREWLLKKVVGELL